LNGSARSVRGNDVAIVGMAGRFPGAATVDEFWRNLRDGVESVTAFSKRDLTSAEVAQSVIDDDSSVKAGGVLADAECFDAQFFGISPAEAELIDPQQRVFLECAWAALEDAGYGACEAPRHIGVYAGTSMSSYLLNVLLRDGGRHGLGLDWRMLIGNDKDHLTARVAYRLDLIGPAVTVQSACSTSLVAVHLAAQGVLSGDCEMALAGGVSIGIPQVFGAAYVKGGIVARDGHCRPFDIHAGGLVGGSGVGVVVLKGLSEALADGDHVHAVIRGSAINNDGRAKVGYNAPSQRGQARAIRSALAAADVPADTIGYVEAHGTATALGDPIEIAALAQAYAGVPGGSCLVGSVKSNIGHLDAAAGIAGLIKTVLCLQQGQIAPSVNFQAPNPELHLDGTPFRVCSSLTEWPRTSTPRRAAVSAFGIGGTNAHVVLEEAPRRETRAGSRPQLLVVSARNEDTLEVAVSRLADALERHPEWRFDDVAFTLQTGRAAFDRRRALTAATADEAVVALRRTPRRTGGPARPDLPVVFLFPGQGGELLRVGEQLRHVHRGFATIVDECAEFVRAHVGVDINAALAGAHVGSREEYGATDTVVAQPALFVLEYALARVWMGWGVEPRAMIGHSLGEYVGACLSGVLTVEGALRVVAERGRLMQELPAGAMLAVGLEESAVDAFLAGAPRLDLDVAAVNGPRTCIISGSLAAVHAAEEALRAQRIPTWRLPAQRAFHSRAMAGVADRIGALVAEQKLGAPRIPYVSTVTGEWVAENDVHAPRFWASHTSECVRFREALKTLAGLGDAAYLEVGPGEDLTRLVKSSSIGSAVVAVASLSSRGGNDEERQLLDAAGVLWAHGATVDWAALRAGERLQRVPLPTYPFARRRYSRADAPVTAVGEAPAPGLARDIASWLYAPAWRCVATRPRPVIRPPHEQPRCVVLHDGCDAGVALVAALARAGAEIIEVRGGSRFSADGRARFTVDLWRAADYEELLGALRGLGRAPVRFVTFLPWGHGPSTAATAVPRPSAVCAPLFHLARAIALNAPPDGATTLVAVTQGAQAIGDEPVVRPLHALAAGALRSIAVEVPHLRFRCIDLGTTAHLDATTSLAQEVLYPTSDVVVAIRGARIFVPCLSPAPPTTAEGGVPSLLREEGVYLLTGGLGGIATTLASYLSRGVRARLVLVSRRSDDRRSAAGQQRIAALETAGATVLALTGDVASVDDMERVRDAAIARFGRVHGIVHAAGVPAGGMILGPPDALLDAVCRPKVEGTLVLDRIFGDTGLDFVMLCSSLVSEIGTSAQAGHAAANAFLDAVPYTELFRGAAVQAINWNTWRDVGMAVDIDLPAELEARRQESLFHGITPDEGARIFALALASRFPRLVVSTRDPRARAVGQTAPSYVAAPAPRATGASRPVSPPPLADRTRGLEDELCRIWADALRLASVQSDDNVFELGADSFVALKVVATIEQRFGCDLSPIVCYEAPTVRLLAGLITGVWSDDELLAQSEARGRLRQRGASP
jgi:phthiocerol/phenolphthiocerol synthesis type-I polyketide synthase E